MPFPKQSPKMEKTPRKTVNSNHVEMFTILDYMKTGKYPPGIPESEKRNLRKRSKSFQICDERLYFIPSDVKKDEDCGTEDPGNIINKRLVLFTMEERINAINDAHVDAKGNHLGREKVSSIITEKYYWVGISKMIRDFIRKCAFCQVNRANMGHPTSLPLILIEHTEEDTNEVEVGSSSTGTLSTNTAHQSILLVPTENIFTIPKIEHLPEPVAFWETVEMCIYGPFISNGNDHYVIVFMDAYSYWPEAFVSDTVSSSVITQLILCLVSRFGVMQKLVFKDTNTYNKEKLYPSSVALREANIDIAFKNIGCQETDGTWQELSEMITNFISNNSDWIHHLEFVLLPHRISRSNRADYTPSFLTYGREINLPTQLSHRNKYQDNLDPHLSFDQKILTVNCLIKAYEIHNNEAKLQQEQEQQAAEEINKQIEKKKKGKRKQNKTSSIRNDTENEDNVIHIGDVTIQETSPKTDIKKTNTDDRPTSPRKRKLKNMTDSENSENNINNDNFDEDSESDDEVLLNEDEPFEHNYANSSAEKVNIDAFYEGIILYINKKKYPPQSGEHFKRIIRKAHTQYKIKENKLYIIGDKHCKEVPATFDERLKLLKSSHIDEQGKHHSKKFMVEKLSESYVWKGLTLDCEAFVQACPDCKFGKVRNIEDSITKTEEINFEHYRENEEALAKEAELNYAQLFSYLQKEKLPANCDTKVLKKLAKNFVLENCTLCYKRDSDSNSRSLELSSRERRKAIKEAHDKDLHVSVKETLENLSLKYLWCGMKNDVESFIKNCCKKKLPNPKSKQALLKKRYTTFKHYIEHDRGEKASKKQDENRRKEIEHETNDVTHPKKKVKRNNDIDVNTKRNDEESDNVTLIVTNQENDKMDTDREVIRVQKTRRVKSVRDIVENQQNIKSNQESVENQPKKSSEQENECISVQSDIPDKATIMEYYNDIEIENVTEVSLDVGSSDVNKEQGSDVVKDVTSSDSKELENQNMLEPEPMSSQSEESIIGSVDKDISEPVMSSSGDLSKSLGTEMSEPDVIVASNSYTDNDDSEPVKSIHVFSTASGEILLMESEVPENEMQLHLTSKTDNVSPLSQSSVNVGEMNINSSIQPQNPDIIQSVAISSSVSYQPQSTNIQTISSSDPVTAVAVNSILPESEQIQIPVPDIVNAQGKITVSQVTSSHELRELQHIIEFESLPQTQHTRTDISHSKPEDEYINNSSGSEDEDEEDVEDGEEEKKEVIEEKQIPYMMPNEQRGPAAFRCHICNKRVRGSVKFKVHMYQHTGEKPFNCQFCEKKFTNPKSQKLHIRKHTGVKPYLCNICGKDFTLVGSLRSHIKIHEKGGNIQVKCHICDRIFASKNRYERHMKYKHPPEPLVFSCEPCNKTFTTARSLKRHNQSHHLHKKDHQCDTCGKQFYRKEYLNSHRLQHEHGTIPRQPRRPKPITHVQNEMQLSTMPYTTSPHTIVDSQIAVSQSVLDQDIGGGYYTITTEPGEDDQHVMHTLVYNYPAVEYEVECGSSANEQLDAEALSAINLLAQASANSGILNA